MKKMLVGLLLFNLWSHPALAVDRVAQVKAFVSRQWERLVSLTQPSSERSPYPGMDKWGNREGVYNAFYDPCSVKVCPPKSKESGAETDEDRKFGFPLKKP